jgi:hypothetical protein
MIRTVPLALLLAVTAGAEDLVPARAADEFVTIRDVTYEAGVVSGSVVNLTKDELRNVRLRIQASWRWKDEKHPGDDVMSWGDTHTIAEIAPGATVGFRHESPTTPPVRDDGWFHAEVTVAGVTRRHVETETEEKP